MAIKLKCPEIIHYSPNRKTIVEFSLRRIFLFSQVNRGVLGIRGQTKRERCVKCRPRNEAILAKWAKNVFCPFEKFNGKLQLVMSTCGLSLRALEGWQANQCFPRLIVFFCGQIACKTFQANRFKIISFSFELQLTTRFKLFWCIKILFTRRTNVLPFFERKCFIPTCPFYFSQTGSISSERWGSNQPLFQEWKHYKKYTEIIFITERW